jgi:hypothetical protein
MAFAKSSTIVNFFQWRLWLGYSDPLPLVMLKTSRLKRWWLLNILFRLDFFFIFFRFKPYAVGVLVY